MNKLFKSKPTEKALIKQTGIILDILNEYSTYTMDFKFDIKGWRNYEQSDKISYSKKDDLKNSIKKGEKTFYTLSDNKTYDEDQLVIGIDNIRDWKINNLD